MRLLDVLLDWLVLPLVLTAVGMLWYAHSAEGLTIVEWILAVSAVLIFIRVDGASKGTDAVLQEFARMRAGAMIARERAALKEMDDEGYRAPGDLAKELDDV